MLRVSMVILSQNTSFSHPYFTCNCSGCIFHDRSYLSLIPSVSAVVVCHNTPLSHPYPTCECCGLCVTTYPYLTLMPRVSVLVVCHNTHFITIVIYPLTARVVGAPQMISQPVSSIFPVLHCHLGLGELQACPFPDVVFPPFPLSALSSSPFHCALQDGCGQT